MKLFVRDSPSRVRAQPLRWVSAILATTLAVAAAAWVLQPEGAATLQSAQPDRSAHVGRAPDRVRLDFVPAPAPGSLAEVVVLSPQDQNLARGPVLTTPGGVTQTIGPLRGRGAYQVVYEVPLVDGEVATGQYWFWYAPTASGSGSRLQSPALLGLLIAAAAALLAGLLAPGRARRYAVHVPAQRPGSTTSTTSPTTITAGSPHPVPAQRSRDHHEGLSPPGSPRREPAPGQAAPGPTDTQPPRQV